jgi:hypothetical protein
MLVRITDLHDEAAVVHGQLAEALADLERILARLEENEPTTNGQETPGQQPLPPTARRTSGRIGLSLCQGLGRTAHRHRRFERINNLS